MWVVFWGMYIVCSDQGNWHIMWNICLVWVWVCSRSLSLPSWSTQFRTDVVLLATEADVLTSCVLGSFRGCFLGLDAGSCSRVGPSVLCRAPSCPCMHVLERHALFFCLEWVLGCLTFVRKEIGSECPVAANDVFLPWQYWGKDWPKERVPSGQCCAACSWKGSSSLCPPSLPSHCQESLWYVDERGFECFLVLGHVWLLSIVWGT